MSAVDTLATVAGSALPLFDISLIVYIMKRKSSKDISIIWAVGLWATSVAMAPAGIMSPHWASKAFNTVNVAMLTVLMGAVIKYR